LCLAQLKDMTAVKYEFVSIQECHDPLVDLSSYDFVLEPSYFKQGLSSTDKMYLRKSVADKLAKIQKRLRNYTFKIWDGYRSRAVQKNIYQKFWNELHEKHPEWNEGQLKQEVSVFVTVADIGHRIPPHATGGTADLTLVDPNGVELDMGTGFDHFGPEAAPLYFEEHDVNRHAKRNRRLLREAMIAEGFRADTEEWWHYDYGNQLWALHYNKPYAIYGETSPEGETVKSS
jgi:D-alanyl-D-alanine dipeptidase